MRPASLWSENGRGLRGENVVLVVISAIVLVLGRLALLRVCQRVHEGRYSGHTYLGIGPFHLGEAG